MANKQNFKPEEWTKILESTMLAGMAVSAAEPNGLLGKLKEAVASGSTLAKAKADSSGLEACKSAMPKRRLSPIYRELWEQPPESIHAGTLPLCWAP